MSKDSKIILVVAAVGLLMMPYAVDAIAPIVPPCARAEAAQETPGIECVVFTFINIAKLILGISGSVALALFVYGGFLMTASGGNETLITKGKNVLSAAVIGLIIVFGAYTGVFFLIKTLTTANREAPGLLECIDLDTGATKPPTVSCGPEQRGRCQSGICVINTRAPLPEGTGCCMVQTGANQFTCAGEMASDACSGIPGSAGIASDYCDNIRAAGGCQ